MADQKPILEPEAKTGAAKRRVLTMNEIIAAEEVLAEGKLTAAEIDEQYPGWEQASAEFKASTADLARAASDAIKGPVQTMADALKNLDLSKFQMTDTLRRATEAATRSIAFPPPPMPREMPVIPYRDPDAATQRVVEEVRQLGGISAAIAESVRINAET